MIGQDQLVNGLWMGALLMTLGLMPGLPENLTKAMNRIAQAASFGIPGTARLPGDLRVPRWFAPAGAMLILGSLIAYLA